MPLDINETTVDWMWTLSIVFEKVSSDKIVETIIESDVINKSI